MSDDGRNRLGYWVPIAISLGTLAVAVIAFIAFIAGLSALPILAVLILKKEGLL